MTQGSSAEWSIRMPMLVGLSTLALLVGFLGVWSVRAKISSAIVVAGVLEVDGYRQLIQHPEGGSVVSILARDGDTVETGDIVLQFDDRIRRAELTGTELQSLQIIAQIARLKAERDRKANLSFPAELKRAALADSRVQILVQGQEQLFEARNKSQREQLEILEVGLLQIENQILGVTSQQSALIERLRLVERELETSRALFENGLVNQSNLTARLKERAIVSAEIGGANSEVARLRKEKATVEIRIVALGTERDKEVVTELQRLEQQANEVERHLTSLRILIDALSVKAPVSGIIFGSTVFAENAVVRPAEPIMFVVPQDRRLVVSTDIPSAEIDRVSVGQKAVLRFSSLDTKQTPEFVGQVAQTSADSKSDATTGERYFVTKISIPDAAIAELENQHLLPGMPVEVFITLSAKTPMEYFTRPFFDFFSKALRED